MIPLRPEERDALARYVYSVSAIALDATKGYLIESRLGRLVEDAGCRSYAEFLNRAHTDTGGSIRRLVIDAITTGETLFFRDSAPFALLRNKILPEAIDRLTRARRVPSIRIWSAACSTGQEVYSIAIAIKEALGDPARYGVRLLGTDISNQAITQASRCVYTDYELSRGVDDAIRDRHFKRVAGGWQVCDEIRALASFRTFNLMDNLSALGRFDIIFCRNVAIYFNERDRISLFTRISRAMESDGALIIGSMESLGNQLPQLQTRRYLNTIYYSLSGVEAR